MSLHKVNSRESSLSHMSSGGIDDSLRGPIYQLKLMELYSVFASLADLEFQLTTELKDAGKFDDLVFNYTSKDGGVKTRLLQAKHRKEPKNMSLDMLFMDKDFSMHKYFVSLLEIKNNFADIEDIVLATNNRFSDMDADILEVKGQKGLEKIFLEKIKNPDFYLNEVGIRYKLVGMDHPQLRESTFDVVKNHFLAQELCTCMFSDVKKITLESFPILSAYREFVLKKIFNQASRIFNHSFIDGTDTTLSGFRESVKGVIFKLKRNTSGSSMKRKDTMKTDIWRYLTGNGKSSNLVNFFNIPVSQPISDIENQMNASIKEFFEKFVYLVDADMESINKAIHQRLKDEYKSEQRALVYSKNLQTRIREIVVENQSQLPITATMVQKFFNEFNFLNLDIHSKEIFEEFDHISFKLPIPGLDEKLLDDKIICIVTPEDETFITCIKIKQFLESMAKNFIFVRSNSSTDIIAKSLKAFEMDVNCCLMEVSNNFDIISQYEDHFLLTAQMGNLIIVTSKTGFIKRLSECKIRNMSAGTCAELTETSIRSLLNKTVEFQGGSTQLKNLFTDEFMNSIGLNLNISVIDNLTSIAKDESTFDSNLSLYIQRIILQENQINSKDSNFCDNATYSEEEFSKACQANPRENVHLLARTIQQNKKKLIWKKSQNKVSNLKKCIIKGEVEEIGEVKFSNSPYSVNILRDSAGMGKSMLFENMKLTLKNENPNHWVIKLDLNNYTKIFEKYQDQKSLSSDEVQKIVINEILKLKNDLDIKLFEFALKTCGNIIIFFDGFDEVARDYKEVVLQIIKFFTINPRIKIFISTRPEWQEVLEDKFSVISYQLKPFEKSDQMKYLKNFFTGQNLPFDPPELMKIAEASLKTTKISITGNEEALTGFPLIIKLLAEFITEKVSDKTFDTAISTIETESYNLYELYQSFINKMIDRHITEKLDLDLTNVRQKRIIEREKAILKELHDRHSIRTIFNSEILEKLPRKLTDPLTEDDYENLTSCGIIVKINDQIGCIHYTFIEQFVAKTLLENLSDQQVAEVAWEVVFKNEGFQVVRMFINHQIRKYKNDENLSVFQEIINKSLDFEAFHTVAKGQNSDIFGFLCESFMFKNQLGHIAIRRICLSTDQDGAILFYYYFRHCDLDIKILDNMKNLYGLSLIKKILTFVNEIGWRSKANLVLASTYNGKNYDKLLKWIFETFINDLHFLRETFMSVDQDGDGILHITLENYNEEPFMELLNILEEMKSVLGQKFLTNLIQLKNKRGQIFFLMMQNSTKLKVLPVFDWIKRMVVDQQILCEIVSSLGTYQESLLHKFSKHCDQSMIPIKTKEIVLWTRDEFGLEYMEDLVLLKNEDGKTFLDLLLFRHDQKEIFSTLVEILTFLISEINIGTQFISDFILQNNEDSGTILHAYASEYKNKSNFAAILKEFLRLIHDYLGKETLSEFLLMKNQYGYLFINYIISNDDKHEAATVLPEILNFLRELFESDEQRLKNFIFEKNYNQNTLLHFYSIMADNSSAVELIKTFLSWIRDQFGLKSVEDMIFMKNKFGTTFLPYLLMKRGVNQSIAEFIVEIKNKLLISQNSLKRLLYSENCRNKTVLHNFASRDNESLIELMKWIQEEFGTKVLEEISSTKDIDGDTFLNFFAFSKNENCSSQLGKVLNHLKSILPNKIERLVLSTNDKYKTILHVMCKIHEISNLENMLSTLIEWFKENLPKSKFDDLIFLKNGDGNLFLHSLLVRAKITENTNQKTECLEIVCKIIIKLHEMTGDKNKLKSLLEQKPEIFMNLVEFIMKNYKNHEFFVDWLKKSS